MFILLYQGEGEEESMWVRMKVWAGMADITAVFAASLEEFQAQNP